MKRCLGAKGRLPTSLYLVQQSRVPSCGTRKTRAHLVYRERRETNQQYSMQREVTFVSSPFLGRAIFPTSDWVACRRRIRRLDTFPPRAMAQGPSWSPFIFRPEDGDTGSDDSDFRPFDGSMPLLPPWRPPTIEAEFRYNAQRIISRENRAASQRELKKIVKVESNGSGTLFAEVVQEVAPPRDVEPAQERVKKLWLRPLLLDSEETFMDLRGGSDLVLDAGKVVEIDGDMRTRLTVNLAATEGDVVNRAVSDERWKEYTSKALLDFMRSLSFSE